MIAASSPFVRLLSLALTIFWIVLLARVILSWLELFGVRLPASGPMRSIADLLTDVTEPVLRPLRKIVPPAGQFDLSVAVAFIIVIVLQQALQSFG
jgi:YggT family protein